MGEKEVKVLVNVGSFRLFFLGRFRRLLISGIKCFKVTYIVFGYALVGVCSPLTGLDTNGVRCLLPLLGLRWFSFFFLYTIRRRRKFRKSCYTSIFIMRSFSFFCFDTVYLFLKYCRNEKKIVYS